MPHEDRTFLDFSHTAINRPYQKVSNKFQLLLPTALTETFSDAKKNVLDISKVTKHFFFIAENFFLCTRIFFLTGRKKFVLQENKLLTTRKGRFVTITRKDFLASEIISVGVVFKKLSSNLSMKYLGSSY